MNELITIIVPVYKVEPYIYRCVDSIINQTYKNLEIILVDDGSPDNCGSICDEYAKQDNRIKVIHKKNGGLSDARNVGIDIACGDYLGFVDSDDWIEPDMVEILIDDATTNNADISCCGYYKVYNDGSKLNNVRGFIDNRVFKGKEIFKNFFLFTDFVIWNKIYKKSIFKEIRFPLGKLYEDTRIMYKICDTANIATWNPLPKYWYFQRDDSIMNFYKFKNEIDRICVWEELRIAVIPKFPELKNYITWSKNMQIVGLFSDVYLNHCEYSNTKELQVIRKQIDLSIIFKKDISANYKYRLLLVLLRFFPSLYQILWKFKKNNIKSCNR